jgi:hypothetical protein
MAESRGVSRLALGLIGSHGVGWLRARGVGRLVWGSISHARAPTLIG